MFATSDIEVKPSYAIAGATGLFASDLLAIRFTDWLKKFPLLFNVMQVSLQPPQITEALARYDPPRLVIGTRSSIL